MNYNPDSWELYVKLPIPAQFVTDPDIEFRVFRHKKHNSVVFKYSTELWTSGKNRAERKVGPGIMHRTYVEVVAWYLRQLQD